MYVIVTELMRNVNVFGQVIVYVTTHVTYNVFCLVLTPVSQDEGVVVHLQNTVWVYMLIPCVGEGYQR